MNPPNVNHAFRSEWSCGQACLRRPECTAFSFDPTSADNLSQISTMAVFLPMQEGSANITRVWTRMAQRKSESGVVPRHILQLNEVIDQLSSLPRSIDSCLLSCIYISSTFTYLPSSSSSETIVVKEEDDGAASGPVTAYPLGNWSLPEALQNLPSFPGSGPEYTVVVPAGWNSLLACAAGKTCWKLRLGFEAGWRQVGSLVDHQKDAEKCFFDFGSEVMLVGTGTGKSTRQNNVSY